MNRIISDVGVASTQLLPRTRLQASLLRHRLLRLFALALTLVPILVQAQAVPIDYYRMGENDPAASPNAVVNTLQDSIGGVSLACVGGPFYSSTVSPQAAATTGSALSVLFFGTINNCNGPVLTTATNNFGVEAWAQASTTTGDHYVAYNGNTGFNGWGLLQRGNTYQALFGGVLYFGSTTATAGTWTHLAIVRDSGTTTFYVNGVASGTTTASPNGPSGGFVISGAPPALDTGFMGNIDEVRVFTFVAGTFNTGQLLYNNKTVTNTNDSGSGSLRAALLSVGAGGAINITATGTITLASPLPPITTAMTINGPGSGNLTVSGANAYRVFFVDAPNASVAINNLTIAHGLGLGGSGGRAGSYGGGGGLGAGGGLFVNRGAVALAGVNFSGNAATGGHGGDTSSSDGFGGGGGGGLGGNGGRGYNNAGGGGGGYLGTGGDGHPNLGNGAGGDGAGGGGGIFGAGGIGTGADGGGGGAYSAGGSGNGAGGTGADGLGGTGGGDGANSQNPTPGNGSTYGGGGGGGRTQPNVQGANGGSGGAYGGGGGASVQAYGGGGGDFGGGGGTGFPQLQYSSQGGAGGFGGGGGGLGGQGGFGGGSGGCCNGGAGAFGGSSNSMYLQIGGGGGGGGALGSAVFVRANNGASVVWSDGSADVGTLTAGTGGSNNVPSGYVVPAIANPGSARGTSLFLLGGTTTFSVSAGTQTIAGSIAGWSGALPSLSKVGSGTLVLSSAANVDLGPFVVAAGTLRVTGLLPSATEVGSGATLSGTGSVTGAVTLDAGAQLVPGDPTAASGIGTLDTGTITWKGGATMAYQLGATNAASNSDQVVVAGDLVKTGSVFKFNFSDGAAAPVCGTLYTLIQITGTNAFSASDFSYAYSGANPTFGSGGTFSFDGTNKQLQFIVRCSQTITNFKATPANPAYSSGGSFSVSATSGGSTSPVVFASTSPTVCSVNGSTVSTLSVGTCALTANEAGDSTHNAAPQITLNVPIAKGAQTITGFSAYPANPVFNSGTFDVSAMGGGSSSDVLFASTTPGKCTTAGGSTITMVSVGTCSLTANQAGDANYNAAATATLNVTIAIGTQTITITSTAPSATVGGPAYTITALGGASGNPITFSIDAASTAGACTLSGATVSFTGAGSCIIDSDQAGNANYAAAPQAKQTVSVAKSSQSITFTNPANQSYSPAGTFAVSASASSGLSVGFVSNTTGVCTVSSSTVSIISAGACSITASQPGNANYSAATPVTDVITISQAGQTIAFISTAPTAATVGGNYTPAANASSGMPVAFTIDAASTAGACSITASTVFFTGAGTCVVDADQAGNTNYTAALRMQQSFAVVTPALAFVTNVADVLRGNQETLQVAIRDASGNVEAGDNTSSVTLSTMACGGSYVLGIATVINGVATFDLRFYTVATFSLSAGSNNATGANSATFNVTANANFVFAGGFESCRP